ncbi:MAG TPA: cob(I)yrinic acid a,c-diamide adenosyltransferase [Acidimicrobiales bacterium]|nr:cob(I)yrinic acid a,c-diamide adenosyltransferase [Acidimicrobiales bacterium]
MRIYTKQGDNGTTALLAGGRVRKDSPAMQAIGAVDEAQSALGLARAECERGDELDELLIGVERDLWILMAELATAPVERHRLEPGVTAATAEMVAALEAGIDEMTGRLDVDRAFAVPGANRLSAALDVARTVVRRAERLVVGLGLEGSQAVAYLNRLSDLCWALARCAEDEHRVNRRPPGARRSAAGAGAGSEAGARRATPKAEKAPGGAEREVRQ